MNISDIRGEWGRRLSSPVAYLPVLGPVFSLGASYDSVVNDLLSTAGTGRFLPYDKNTRWFEKPKERILFDSVKMHGDILVIPTLYLSGKRLLKLFCYSQHPIDDSAIEKIPQDLFRIIEEERIDDVSLILAVYPKTIREVATRSIYLQTIGKENLAMHPDVRIRTFRSLRSSERESFTALATDATIDGFSFLARFLAENPDRETLCLLEDGKVLGAIGPLDIGSDGWGKEWLLPPYFGVSKDSRGRGVGSALWNAAMRFAASLDASYTLVQNVPGTDAAAFYEFSGLKRYDYFVVSIGGFPIGERLEKIELHKMGHIVDTFPSEWKDETS